MIIGFRNKSEERYLIFPRNYHLIGEDLNQPLNTREQDQIEPKNGMQVQLIFQAIDSECFSKKRL